MIMPPIGFLYAKGPKGTVMQAYWNFDGLAAAFKMFNDTPGVTAQILPQISDTAPTLENTLWRHKHV